MVRMPSHVPVYSMPPPRGRLVRADATRCCRWLIYVALIPLFIILCALHALKNTYPLNFVLLFVFTGIGKPGARWVWRSSGFLPPCVPTHHADRCRLSVCAHRGSPHEHAGTRRVDRRAGPFLALHSAPPPPPCLATESAILGIICVMYYMAGFGDQIILAAAITIAIFLVLTLYTMQSKVESSPARPFVCAKKALRPAFGHPEQVRDQDRSRCRCRCTTGIGT